LDLDWNSGSYGCEKTTRVEENLREAMCRGVRAKAKGLLDHHPSADRHFPSTLSLHEDALVSAPPLPIRNCLSSILPS
jgi:hypothetical protein